MIQRTRKLASVLTFSSDLQTFPVLSASTHSHHLSHFPAVCSLSPTHRPSLLVSDPNLSFNNTCTYTNVRRSILQDLPLHFLSRQASRRLVKSHTQISERLPSSRSRSSNRQQTQNICSASQAKNMGNREHLESLKTFSVADYTVFAGMLTISSSIGVYYAWTVSCVTLPLHDDIWCRKGLCCRITIDVGICASNSTSPLTVILH